MMDEVISIYARLIEERQQQRERVSVA
jgi:hypothetical protein